MEKTVTTEPLETEMFSNAISRQIFSYFITDSIVITLIMATILNYVFGYISHSHKICL